MNNTVSIKVRYLNPKSLIPRLSPIVLGDGVDVRAHAVSLTTPYGRVKLQSMYGEIQNALGEWENCRYVQLKKGARFRVHLGFSAELPEGYKAVLIPRSSTPEKLNAIQANSEGLIDQTYNGNDDEWMQEFIALDDTVIIIGERIGQFYVQKHERVILTEVESLKDTSRGGFGKGTGHIK